MILTRMSNVSGTKRAVLVGAALTLIALTTGCQQLAALEEQQATMQQTLDRNAQQTDTLVEQSESFQRSITEAVLTLCDEQLTLKQGLAETQADQTQLTDEIAADQDLRAESFERAIGDLSARLDETVTQLQGLTETLGDLSQVQEQEKQLAVGMVLLNDTQKALQESLSTLEAGHAAVLQTLAELQQGYRTSQDRLQRLEDELAALKRGS